MSEHADLKIILLSLFNQGRTIDNIFLFFKDALGEIPERTVGRAKEREQL